MNVIRHFFTQENEMKKKQHPWKRDMVNQPKRGTFKAPKKPAPPKEKAK
ncbi:unnamed protein product [marine sediment metagenome]|uniref:Uncharacterized protein n=1 Tax=marine sediment metagenome TaxID=412755 RepID=X0RWB5_9ZZZZ